MVLICIKSIRKPLILRALLNCSMQGLSNKRRMPKNKNHSQLRHRPEKLRSPPLRKSWLHPLPSRLVVNWFAVFLECCLDQLQEELRGDEGSFKNPTEAC